ncbi:unnamed protein product [Amoebophrya sp. A120]|nr:unnamed protein product [Amoebophrya sp. A120]|eukprot:GSA120T00000429001.1
MTLTVDYVVNGGLLHLGSFLKKPPKTAFFRFYNSSEERILQEWVNHENASAQSNLEQMTDAALQAEQAKVVAMEKMNEARKRGVETCHAYLDLARKTKPGKNGESTPYDECMLAQTAMREAVGNNNLGKYYNAGKNKKPIYGCYNPQEPLNLKAERLKDNSAADSTLLNPYGSRHEQCRNRKSQLQCRGFLRVAAMNQMAREGTFSTLCKSKLKYSIRPEYYSEKERNKRDRVKEMEGLF